MKTIIASRWFALADLGIAILSGAIWYIWPQAGGWPLVVVLLPWLIRAAAGHFPVRRTVFWAPLAIFLLTAAVGVWASYNREAGWAKFWVIVGAVILFFALAGQPRENLWLVAGLLGILGGTVSTAFLLGQDFQKQPIDLEVLQRIGAWWMSIRPVLYTADLPPNSVAGILAALTPFPLALGIAAWRERRLAVGIFSWTVALIILLGLALTSSRGAWAALSVAAGIWAAYEFRGYPAWFSKHSHRVWFTFAIIITAVAILSFVTVRTGGIVGLLDRLPGLPSGSSRYELARNTLHLIVDFPFTGGGLAAFAGLYSQYIMVIPVFLFGYSHNFYLDVAVEQGLLALLALLGIYLGSLFLLLSSSLRRNKMEDLDLLLGGVLAGLIVVGLHGLVDDPLYGNLGMPLLFFLPAISCALVVPASVNGLTTSINAGRDRLIIRKENISPILDSKKKLVGVIGIGIFSAACLLTVLWKPIAASWYANFGAVQMARAELASFPSGSWELDRKQKIFEVSPANLAPGQFERSVQLDPGNVTAQYRLGLISLYGGDFNSALFHLERAYQAAPDHRGVIKVLGYCYVWADQIDQALPLLKQIPEAGQEMDIYAWWWKVRGSAIIADRSARAAILLANAENPNQK